MKEKTDSYFQKCVPQIHPKMRIYSFRQCHMLKKGGSILLRKEKKRIAIHSYKPIQKC